MTSLITSSQDDRKRYAVENTPLVNGLRSENKRQGARIEELSAEVSNVKARHLQVEASIMLTLTKQVPKLIIFSQGEIEKIMKQNDNLKVQKDNLMREKNLLTTERDEYKDSVRNLKVTATECRSMDTHLGILGTNPPSQRVQKYEARQGETRD